MTLGLFTRSGSGRLGVRLIAAVCLLLFAGYRPAGGAQEEVLTFAIETFAIEGNSVLEPRELETALAPFVGDEKTAKDVEKAREALEGLYHELGYPTVLVNIPEQGVESGEVRLEVIESRIRRVRVTGSRYFSPRKVLEELPSFQPDSILFLPNVQAELSGLNRNPDLSVTPVMAPGRRLGTIDVELKVDDRLPLHGSLEFNNRSTHTTSDQRLIASLRYDNLWLKGHSVSLQYQISPEQPDEVQVVAGSYMLPSPWGRDQQIVLYAVASDSESAFGEGFEVIGKGEIYGLRYVVGLPAGESYFHNLTVGLDYKDFDESIGREDQTGTPLTTPMRYLPLSLAYTGFLADPKGQTQFSFGINLALRDLIDTDPVDFDVKRFKARGNYLYVTGGVERTHKLPYGLGLFVKADGQIATEPLISNEQYVAGGVDSVRGYKESEAVGDHALHGRIELSGPDLFDLAGVEPKADIVPHVFWDGAYLRLDEPLPGETEETTLSAVGVGVGGAITKWFSYGLDWGMPLSATDNVDRRSGRLHFRFKGEF